MLNTFPGVGHTQTITEYEQWQSMRQERGAARLARCQAEADGRTEAENAAILGRKYRLYDLQQAACSLFPGRRALQGCSRWMAHGKKDVGFYAYPSLAKGKVLGLQTCSSPLICPVCAAKISERRVKHDLIPGLARSRELKHGHLLITYKVAHKMEDGGKAYDILDEAREKLMKDGSWARLRKKYNVVGHIRAFESTYGTNGHHPHFHEILIFEVALTETEIAEFTEKMKKCWSRCIEKIGGRAVTMQQGLDVSSTHEAIEEYIQKQLRAGVQPQEVKRPKWDYPQELGKGSTKNGRSHYQAGEKVKGWSMFELLGVVADGHAVDGMSVQRAAHAFREYEAAITKHQLRALYFSKGLKKLLGIDDLTDEQIEALEDEEYHRVKWDSLTDAGWSALAADGLRACAYAYLPNALHPSGDRAGLAQLLAPYKAIRCSQKYIVDGETGQRHYYDVPEFDPNSPAIVSSQIRLEDPYSDERDKRLVVGRYVDPLEILHNVPAETAIRLRQWQADGETVHSLEEQNEIIRANREHIPEVLREGSPLGPIVKRYGRFGLGKFLGLVSCLAGDLDWADTDEKSAYTQAALEV